MEFALSTVWLLWVVFTAVAAANVWLFQWQRARQDRRYQQSPQKDAPQVAVITCLKGFDAELTPAFLRSLCCQRYANYRLIFSFEDDREPAIGWIQRHLLRSDQLTGANGPKSISVVVAGYSTGQGQKVHNQLAAFERLTAEDQIIAFADADIVCTTDWLDMLTSPITKDRYHVATGSRMPVPMDGALATLTASTLLSSLVTLASFDILNITWGGSMAISREAYDKVNVPRVLKGCVNDDVRLATQVWQNGFPVGRRLSLLVASPVSHTWPSFWEFSARQYYQIKKYSPVTFLLAMYPTFLSTIGFLSASVAGATGNTSALAALALATGFDQVRAVGRQRAISSCVEPEHLGFSRRMNAMQHLLTPYWMAIHACVLIKAIPQKTITWGGITYQVVRQNETLILDDPRQQQLAHRSHQRAA